MNRRPLPMSLIPCNSPAWLILFAPNVLRQPLHKSSSFLRRIDLLKFTPYTTSRDSMKFQRGKRYGNGRGPPVSGYPCFGSPDPIPTRVSVLGIPGLLVGDESISLCAQRIDLEDVSIAPITPRVDHDLKIVIQFLSHISSELGSDGTACEGIVTRDSEIDFMLGVEDTEFRLFSRGLPLVGFPLQKVCDRSGPLPERIVKRAIQLRRPVNWAGLRASKWFLNPKLPLVRLLT